jgi:hypothetical protein
MTKAATKTTAATEAQTAPTAPVLIVPSVGRKVWYRHNEDDRTAGMQIARGQPLDATVLAVWGDRCINAEVTDVVGQKFVRRSWLLKQQGDEFPDGVSYFEWMPYQTGQAAKAV